MAASDEDEVTFRLDQVVVIVRLLFRPLNREQLREDCSLELEKAQKVAFVGGHLVKD